MVVLNGHSQQGDQTEPPVSDENEDDANGRQVYMAFVFKSAQVGVALYERDVKEVCLCKQQPHLQVTARASSPLSGHHMHFASDI